MYFCYSFFFLFGKDLLQVFMVPLLLFSCCSKTGAISYKAQSQDEDALVHAAAKLLMVLVNRNANILGTNHFLLSFVLCIVIYV